MGNTNEQLCFPDSYMENITDEDSINALMNELDSIEADTSRMNQELTDDLTEQNYRVNKLSDSVNPYDYRINEILEKRKSILRSMEEDQNDFMQQFHLFLLNGRDKLSAKQKELQKTAKERTN